MMASTGLPVTRVISDQKSSPVAFAKACFFKYACTPARNGLGADVGLDHAEHRRGPCRTRIASKS
jgi:hypothetical protein